MRNVSHSLVGKIISNKELNREAFKATIAKIWRTTKEISVKSKGMNMYIFRFKCVWDRKKVLEGGPWCLNKQLIVLQKADGMVAAAICLVDVDIGDPLFAAARPAGAAAFSSALSVSSAAASSFSFAAVACPAGAIVSVLSNTVASPTDAVASNSAVFQVMAVFQVQLKTIDGPDGPDGAVQKDCMK
ncbi:hypothetical protein ACOSQ3_023285 [Xanthoceras sorbifolium]